MLMIDKSNIGMLVFTVSSAAVSYLHQTSVMSIVCSVISYTVGLVVAFICVVCN